MIAPAVLARIVAPHRGQSYSRYCEDVTSWQISSHIAWSADVDKLDQGSGRELPRTEECGNGRERSRRSHGAASSDMSDTSALRRVITTRGYQGS